MGREGLIFDERIEAFSYLIVFMSTFAMPCVIRGGWKLQPLRVKLEGVTIYVQNFLAEVRGGAETDDF